MRRRRLWLCLAVLLAVATPAHASASELLEHERYLLNNGLEVILLRDQRLPLIALNLSYHVGSAHDGKHPGLAHLTEHMMFRGTKDIDDGEYTQRLSAAGAQCNASTQATRTTYHCVLPSNQLPLALWLESNRMGYLLPALTVPKVREERTTTIEEWRYRISSERWGGTFEALWASLYPPGHPRQPAPPDWINKLGLTDVRAFVDEHHGPGNATLVLAGDLPEDVHKLIARDFKRRRGGHRPAPPSIRPPRQDKERRVTRRSDFATNPTLIIHWHTPGLFEPGDADADIMAQLLSESFQDHAEFLAPGLVLHFSARQRSLIGGSEFHVAIEGSSSSTPAQLLAVYDRIFTEVDGELSPAMIADASLAMRVTKVDDLQPLEARADQLQSYVNANKPANWLDEDLARYDRVNRESLEEFVSTFLRPELRTVVLAYPAIEQDVALDRSEGP